MTAMQITDVTDTLLDLVPPAAATPFVLGVSGGQGAGKSTLCAAFAAALAAQGKTAAVLGLDDFYLPQAARIKLAETVSPLCRTRGVPGTHDIGFLRDTLQRLMTAAPDTVTPLPVFSKSADDRLPEAAWSSFTGRPDVILIEGWCVGGRAAFLDGTLPTAWEAEHDPDAVWKSWSLACAADYEAVWDACDSFILLQHADFDSVIDSRWQQEQANAAAGLGRLFASRDEVAAFCAHYESWTKAVWRHLPPLTALHIQRDGSGYQRLGPAAAKGSRPST